MSRIDELIQKLCPNVVENKELRELFNISRGRVMSKEYLRDNSGVYPVYSSQTANNGEIGKISTYDYNGEYLTWTTDGANAGTVFYRNGEFSITNVCGLLESKTTEVDVKFAYYVLRVVMKDYVSSGMGNPKLMSCTVEKISIPLPPLPVQQEIVNILDKFTSLEAELEAELEARKKQYEYYRNQLFNFEGKDVEWKTLGEISSNVSSGGTPLSTRKEYYNGDIPWLRTQEVRFNEIFETENTITDKGLKESSAKWIPVNCVIIAISGATAGRSAINKIPLTTNQHCCNFEIDPMKAQFRYVFHWVSSKHLQLKSMGQGARSDLNAGIIKSFSIPIPPLSEQERIVGLLDKFDTLVNDISEGLPAEIEARRKQYEYYRGKLLDFKPLTN